MNVPNKLSLFRVVLVPVLVVVYYFGARESLNSSPLIFDLFLGPIFVVASITDFLDGYIARKKNLVTVFGKFIDPLADKLIVMAALLILNDAGIIPVWITVVILSREFIVTGIRLVAVGEGKVIAASKLGKYKTASTMVALVILLFTPYFPGISYLFIEEVGMYVLYLGTLLTVVSGVDYFIKNKEIIMASI
jgi:CDP-diacylglycerol--glycerol-3-phosphate 3-phosphatidyltransferase